VVNPHTRRCLSALTATNAAFLMRVTHMMVRLWLCHVSRRKESLDQSIASRLQINKGSKLTSGPMPVASRSWLAVSR
jgi:hypothetical protein